MLSRHFIFSLFSYCILLSVSSSLPLPVSPSSPTPRLNISYFLYPHYSTAAAKPQPSSFLKNVLKGIKEKEKWDLKDVRVSKLDLKNTKLGALQSYEFRVQFGRSEFVFKLFDQVSQWKSFRRVDNESDFEASVKEISSRAVLESFRIQGPFHLRVAGDHNLTIMLPLNASFAGIKHVIVGEGITVEVNGAEEVSLLHRTSTQRSVAKRTFSFLWPSSCLAWLPVRILGSATAVAYQARNPEAYIQTLFPSKGTIELLQQKCYSSHVYRNWDSSMDLLSTKIALVRKLFHTFLGHKTYQDAGSGFLHAKIKPTSIFRFKLELEREIHSNDGYWSTFAEWRTRPTVERSLYEVVARFEAEGLKPLTVKKIEPFIRVDTKDWGNLLSNVSFTKFPPILVPQESLTLDVK